MRRDADYFHDEEPVLLYIAKKLKEALALESLLTANGVDYGVEPDTYQGGIIFRTERVGAFFYVQPGAVMAARHVLSQNGYRPHETAG